MADDARDGDRSSGRETSVSDSGKTDRKRRAPFGRILGYLATGRRGERERLGYPEIELRDALHRAGCPVCAVEARTDDRYVSAFLHESYQEPEVIASLIGSFGFCRAHADMHLERPAAAAQIAVVHEVLARHLVDRLDSRRSRRKLFKRLADPRRGLSPCPACRFARQSEVRSVWFLASLFGRPGERSLYASPHLLCLPHLSMIASRGSEELVRWMLPIHAAEIESCLAAAEAASFDERALRIAAGAFPGRPKMPLAFDRGDCPTDAIDRVVAGLAVDGDCVVCREERRAVSEWYAWLAAAAERDASIEDLLPLCPIHLWAGARYGNRHLAHATERHALGSARTRLALVLKTLGAERQHPLGPWISALGIHDGPLVRAREALARGGECPVCKRIGSARERTLLLVFALLEEGRHRAAFERGYGLCVRHFAHVPGLRPTVLALDSIVTVERAKLALVAWTLEEYLRKTSWSQRPEAKGGEATAAWGAARRFSGAA